MPTAPSTLPPAAEAQQPPSLLRAMFMRGTPMLWVPSGYFTMALTYMMLHQRHLHHVQEPRHG